MKALRSWRVWFAGFTGLFLVFLTVVQPDVWWTLLLWMIPAGAVVGQARHPATARSTATPPDRPDRIGS